MPTWPAGVETGTIVFGKGLVANGDMTSATLEVEPIYGGITQTAVWDGDGTPLYSFKVNAIAESGQPGSVTVPVVDQTGWLDDDQREYSLWAYKLTETAMYGNRVGIPRVKYLQLLSGQGEIDFDRIPNGRVGLPVSAPVVPVTSVAGFTGPVTVEKLREAGVGDATDDSVDAVLALPDGKAAARVKGQIETEAARLVTPVATAVAGKVSVSTPLVRNAKKLARWRTAFAQARFIQQGVVVLGDSITDGGNANNAPISTDTDKTLARLRGWVSQLRDALAARLGITAGEGFVWLKQTVAGVTAGDGRWTFATNESPSAAAGVYGWGRRLAPGNDVTALDQRFTVIEVEGWSGGVSGHLIDCQIDDVNRRPSVLPADALAGVVAAGKWQARGSGTTVAADGNGGIAVTRTTSDGGIVLDYGTKQPCVAGQWLAAMLVQSKSGSARTAALQVTFYDDADATVGAADQTIATRSSGATTGSQMTGFVQVPAGATKFMVTIRGNSWVVGETATFTKVDLVPVQRVTVAGSSGSYYSYRTSPVALGLHKVKLVAPVSDNADVSGIILRDRLDAGVLVHRMGRPGATTATVTGSDTAAGTDATAIDQRLAAVMKVPATVTPTPLLIVALGTNNPGNSISAADYRAQLKQITDYQSALGGCTLLVAGPRFATGSIDLAPYYAQALDLSNTDDHVAFLDIADSWGGNASATAAGFMAFALGIHPTLAGHGDYANIVLDGITRQSITAA